MDSHISGCALMYRSVASHKHSVLQLWPSPRRRVRTQNPYQDIPLALGMESYAPGVEVSGGAT